MMGYGAESADERGKRNKKFGTMLEKRPIGGI